MTVGQIRLLKLSRDDDNQTSFELEVYDIDSAPAFAALSYVCGDETPSCKLMLNMPRDVVTTQTFEDGTWTIFTTPNLETTLGQLANFSRNKKSYLGHDYLWVDAICIDQSNLQEKSLQVSSMYKIYTAAQEVLICLGRQEDSSSAIMTVLKRVAVLVGYVEDRPADTESVSKGIISEDHVRAFAVALKGERKVHFSSTTLPGKGLPPIDDVFWQGLERIFYREWFWRLWTFQEGMLARRGYVLCGDQGIQWDHLLPMSTSLKDTGLMYVSRAGVKLPPRVINAGLLPGSPIFDLQNTFDGTDWSYCWAVNAARSREVSEPRDRVYGILSLSPPDLRQWIDVDYTIPLPQLYTAFTRALLQVNARTLYLVFRMIDSVDRLPGLPNWCPDYGQLPNTSNFALFYPLSTTVTSGSSFGCEKHIFEPALRLQGAKFDTVEAVVPAFEVDWNIANRTASDDAYAYMLEWLEACWSLIQERGVEETDHLFAGFTSIVLVEEYPTR